MLSTSWQFGAVSGELRSLRAACNIPDVSGDEKSLHLIILEDGLPIACGSLLFDRAAYRIAQIGVLPSKRKQGVGDLLTRILLMRAFNMMADRVCCTLTPENIPFFTQYGFHAVENNEWEVTPQTLTLESKCGHDCSSCICKDSCRS